MAMWHFISDHISRATDSLFVCQSSQPAHGGDTHQCYILRDDRRRYFVKVRANDGSCPLLAEKEGLAALAQTNTVRTPTVICHGVTDERPTAHEYLVLQHVRFRPCEPDDYYTLGEQLAALHRMAGYPEFGWHQDNFIGASVQYNGWHANWAQFYTEQRIASMLERLAAAGTTFRQTDALLTRIQQLLASHTVSPALLHGDLWSGNVGCCHHGPIVFDPAVSVGDREADLAMTRLFGGFPPAFYDGYAASYPLPSGAAEREPVYQLYHILNHALLFGDPYWSQAKSVMISLIQHRQ